MSHPDPEVLAGLALGDDVGPDERDHVRACPSCGDHVDALARVLTAAGSAEVLVPAPHGLRDRVLAETAAAEGEAQDVHHVHHVHHVHDVPAPAPVVPLEPRERRRRGVPAWLAGVAAAVTLAAGVGLGRMSVDTATTTPDDDTGSVVAATDLAPLLGRTASGQARAISRDGVITLRVSAHELGEGSGFHEVWLLNTDGERMVALGLLASGEQGDFQVPKKLLDEGYRIVDISIEPDDGDPTHSGVSLVRGELT